MIKLRILRETLLKNIYDGVSCIINIGKIIVNFEN